MLTKTDNNVRIIVTSSGTWLICPPMLDGDSLKVTIFGGAKRVLELVEIAPSSPLRTHHGDTSEIINKPIKISLKPVRYFFFLHIKMNENKIKIIPK